MKIFLRLIGGTACAVFLLSACYAFPITASQSHKWKVHVGSRSDTWIEAPVAVSNGMVFVAAAEPQPGRYPWGEYHYLQGFSASDGVFKWHMEHGGFEAAQPVTDGTTVYFASAGAGAKLFAVDPATGVPRWKLSVASLNEAASPTIYDGAVYVECVCERGAGLGPLGRVAAIDSQTGASKWEIDLEEPEDLSVAVSDEMVFFLDSHALKAAERRTGRVRWQFKPEYIVPISPAVAGNLVFVVGYENAPGELLALDQATGTEQWRVSIEKGAFSTLDVLNDVAYVGTFEHPPEFGFSFAPTNYLYAIDLETRRIRWRFDDGPTMGHVAVDGNTLYFSTYYKLYALNRETGKTKWTFAGQGLFAPTVVDHVLYVGDRSGYLYAIPVS